jgi:hypothetical protein
VRERGRGADWKRARGLPFFRAKRECEGRGEAVVRSSVVGGHYGSVELVGRRLR